MNSRADRSVYLNGKFVPLSEATVRVTCPGFAFAMQVYDVLGGYWNESDQQLYLFRLHDHAQRLADSMKLMRFEPDFSVADIEEAVLSTVRRNKVQEDIALRLIAYLEGVDGVGDLTDTGPVGLLICPIPLPPPQPPGVRAVVSSWPRIPDHVMPPRIKAPANYLNARHAQMEAERAGAHHAIMLNDRHKVAELPRYCFFMVRNGQVACPSVTSDQLESITRRSVLEILRGPLQRTVQERDIDRTELLLAEEAWLGASITGVKAIVEIDGVPVGRGEPGPVCGRVDSLLQAAKRGTTPEFAEWRTAV